MSSVTLNTHLTANHCQIRASAADEPVSGRTRSAVIVASTVVVLQLEPGRTQ